MEVSVDTRELIAFERRLALAGKATQKNITSILKTIGNEVLKRARVLCPISPSKTQYEATLKGRGRKQQTGASVELSYLSDGTVVPSRTLKGTGRRIRTKRRTFERGFLTRSITSEVKRNSVEIGIPSNAPAQEYAEKIHDEKGKTWQKLGLGSIVKGATDKFIFKAQEQTEPIYMKEVEKLVDKLIASI